MLCNLLKNMTEETGEDGLTVAKRMHHFDRLPRPIRLVLIDAPYNYDVRDIRRAWLQHRRLGGAAWSLARTMRADFQRQAKRQQFQKIGQQS